MPSQKPPPLTSPADTLNTALTSPDEDFPEHYPELNRPTAADPGAEGIGARIHVDDKSPGSGPPERLPSGTP
jgi:hypothetical protein